MANFAIIEDFSPGFLAKRDPTQMPPGALIVGSQNVVITDGDQVAARPGSVIDGDSSSASTPIMSKYTFRKRDGSEIEMRTYGTVVEYKHPTLGTWNNLASSYTTGELFGFTDHNVNTDLVDKIVFCNGVEPLSTWNGSTTQLNGALLGGEATITVATTLQDFVYYSGASSVTTTTTIDIATSGWATDLWNGANGTFYVYITSGAQAGTVSLITDSTATQITFDVIAGLAGNPSFEIRKSKFRTTGSDMKLRIGTSTVTYTGITATTFTGCSGTPAAADNAAVAQYIQEHNGAPRGNILLTEKTRVYVAGVTKSPSTLYYSKIADATDFSYTATRVATEGGVVDTPEGGGAITGLGVQEGVIYIMKNNLIKTLYFTQDGTDLPVISTLIEGPDIGPNVSTGVFKVDNQIYYTTKLGAVKTISRVASVDYIQALQLSDPISAYVVNLDFTAAAGIFFRQKAYIACKASSASARNDLVLVYNFQKKAWEPPIVGWNVNAWTIYGNELHFGSSANPVSYKMDTTRYDDNGFPYECVARFAFSHFGEPTKPKDYSMLFMEGYITENTTITIKSLYNYNGAQQERQTTLAGTETDYIVADAAYNALGADALALDPLAGTVESTDDLQKFRVYLTTQRNAPVYELSAEVSSNDEGSRWGILRFGYDVQVRPEPVTALKKKLA